MRDKAASIGQRIGLFFFGLALGILLEYGVHRTDLEDVAEYQEKARDAQRIASNLRKEQERRGGNGNSTFVQ